MKFLHLFQEFRAKYPSSTQRDFHSFLDLWRSSEFRDSWRILLGVNYSFIFALISLGSSLEKCWSVVDWTHSWTFDSKLLGRKHSTGFSFPLYRKSSEILSCTSSSHVYCVQFFIGDLVGKEATNSVPRALLDRLVLAAQHSQNFKVIILLPLHPEGDFLNDDGPLGVMHFQYQTISRLVSETNYESMMSIYPRGVNSFIEQFKIQTSADPSEYICFCSLRNWGHISDKLLTEQIYVHDKVFWISILIFQWLWHCVALDSRRSNYRHGKCKYQRQKYDGGSGQRS